MRAPASQTILTLTVLALALPCIASVTTRDSHDIHLPGMVNGPVAEGPSAQLYQAPGLMGITQMRNRHPQIDGAGYAVVVIDTGVDYTHPALADRYLGGYDFVNDDADPMDDYGHGTHVAGIIASEHSTYTGLAPRANVISLKVLDEYGSGTWGDIESALRWCVQHRRQYNIRAVNLSLGTSTVYTSPASSLLSDEFRQLRNAGVVNVCSSGNDYGSHHTSGGGVGYPAADPCTLSVGAVWSGDFGRTDWSGGAIDYTSAADRIVSFTDRHTDMLDMLAPGAWIASCNGDWETQGDWVYMSGTSMASPMIAAAATLVSQAIEDYWDPADWPEPELWQQTILDILTETGLAVLDGDDEDDNVTNLRNADFYRPDLAAAVDYVYQQSLPEPGSIALLLAGVPLILVHRRRRLGKRAAGG